MGHLNCRCVYFHKPCCLPDSSGAPPMQWPPSWNDWITISSCQPYQLLQGPLNEGFAVHICILVSWQCLVHHWQWQWQARDVSLGWPAALAGQGGLGGALPQACTGHSAACSPIWRAGKQVCWHTHAFCISCWEEWFDLVYFSAFNLDDDSIMQANLEHGIWDSQEQSVPLLIRLLMLLQYGGAWTSPWV